MSSIILFKPILRASQSCVPISYIIITFFPLFTCSIQYRTISVAFTERWYTRAIQRYIKPKVNRFFDYVTLTLLNTRANIQSHNRFIFFVSHFAISFGSRRHISAPSELFHFHPYQTMYFPIISFRFYRFCTKIYSLIYINVHTGTNYSSTSDEREKKTQNRCTMKAEYIYMAHHIPSTFSIDSWSRSRQMWSWPHTIYSHFPVQLPNH